jgi:hypothetical protein
MSGPQRASHRTRCLPRNVFTLYHEQTSSSGKNDMGHIENDASNNSSIVPCVVVTAVTFLPSRCVATIRDFLSSRCQATTGGYTDTQTAT